MTSPSMVRLLRHIGEHSGPDMLPLPLRECAVLLGLDGLALSLDADSHSELLDYTGARTTQLDDLQFTQGHGPSIDASRSGALMLLPDLDRVAPGRWPDLVPAIDALGVRAVFAFPLLIGAIHLGVLTGHRTTRGFLTESQLADALTLTIGLTLLLLGTSAHPHDPAAWLNEEPALHRAEVHQATGMLAAQRDISCAEALLRIRAHAYQRSKPILDIARSILDRSLDLSGD
ncbi:ANTAR domain-containing protein [Streptacidiphilus sp. PAMC 29251]